MIRLATAAALVAAAFVTPNAAHAVCPSYLGYHRPEFGVQGCVSLVNNCADANVYYRVFGASGNTESLYNAVCIP